MKMRLLLLVLALCFIAPSALSAQPLPSADAILSQAKTEAVQQHKTVFLLFHASWCGWCRRLDAYLDSPDVRPIIERYFVIARIDAMEKEGRHPELNTPGGDELLKKLGGSGAMPFFAFLKDKGDLIVTSNAPDTGNIGFPAQPNEIDWFMKMIAKAVPSMTSEEAKMLEARLRGFKQAPANKPSR
jgi:thiol-disulfide isomerase/thioredoxin